MMCEECTFHVSEEYRDGDGVVQGYCYRGYVKETCELLAATFGTPASPMEREIIEPTINHSKDVIAAVLDEIIRTRENPNKGPFKSPHEALGVMLEEWDEFKDEIHANNLQNACKEALQIAGVALNFVIDFKQPFKKETSCWACKFVTECIGPRENGCRLFPEKNNEVGI